MPQNDNAEPTCEHTGDGSATGEQNDDASRGLELDSSASQESQAHQEGMPVVNAADQNEGMSKQDGTLLASY